MIIDRLRLRKQDNLKNTITSFIKPRICLIAAMAIVFAGFAGLTASQLKTYTVYADGEQKRIVSSSNDSASVLKEAGVELSDADVVKTEINNQNKTILYVIRKCRLEITADGETTEYIVNRDTVGNVLSEIGIKISANDVVNLSLNSMLPTEAEITVDRVEYKTIKKDEVVSYSQYINLVKSDGNLDKDILQLGQQGVVTTVYKNKMVNGEIAESVVVDRLVSPIVVKAAAAPVKTAASKSSSKVVSSTYANVVTVSTLKPSINIELDKNGIPVNYKKLITGKATAYTADQGARTSTGKTPQPGYIAVNPNQIPYGTKMYIRTPDNKIIYGYAVAADTGGFAKSGRITADLYFSTYDECVKFGVRNIEIYIIE